jgi:hypothetical protein
MVCSESPPCTAANQVALPRLRSRGLQMHGCALNLLPGVHYAMGCPSTWVTPSIAARARGVHRTRYQAVTVWRVAPPHRSCLELPPGHGVRSGFAPGRSPRGELPLHIGRTWSRLQGAVCAMDSGAARLPCFG